MDEATRKQLKATIDGLRDASAEPDKRFPPRDRRSAPPCEHNTLDLRDESGAWLGTAHPAWPLDVVSNGLAWADALEGLLNGNDAPIRHLLGRDPKKSGHRETPTDERRATLDRVDDLRAGGMSL